MHTHKGGRSDTHKGGGSFKGRMLLDYGLVHVGDRSMDGRTDGQMNGWMDEGRYRPEMDRRLGEYISDRSGTKSQSVSQIHLEYVSRVYLVTPLRG